MPWNQKTTLHPYSDCYEETVPSSSSLSCLLGDPDTSIRSVTKIDHLHVREEEEEEQAAHLNQPQQLHEPRKVESALTELPCTTVRNRHNMTVMSAADPLPPPPQQQPVEKREHFRYDSNSTATTATTTMTRSPSSPAEHGATLLASSSLGRLPTTSEPHPTEIVERTNAPPHQHQQQKISSATGISGWLRPSPNDETVLSLRDLYTDLESSAQTDRHADKNNDEEDQVLRRRSSYLFLEDDTYGNEETHNHHDNDDEEEEEEDRSMRPRNQSEARKRKSARGEIARCDTPPNCLDAAAPPPPPDASASAALHAAAAAAAAGGGGASLSSSWSSSGVSSSAASTAATMALYHRPVAYCAIGGSLEDPSGNSFGWRQQVEKAYLKQQQQQQQLGKYEFSSTLGLLPPPNHLLQQQQQQPQPSGKKKKNGIISNPTLSFDATPVTRTSKKSLITANAEHYTNHSKTKTDPVGTLTADASSSAKVSLTHPMENSMDTNRPHDQSTLATDTGGGAAGATAAPDSFLALPPASASSTTPGRKLDKRKQISSSPATGAETLSTLGDLATEKKLISNLRRKNKSPSSDQSKSKKKVTISTHTSAQPQTKRKSKNKAPLQPPELFRPSSDAYTPRMGKKEIKYKPAEMRTPVQKMASPLGTLQRPNFRDALRRVAMILHQHVVKIERRFENKELLDNDGLFKESMQDVFHEENYKTPTYKCTMVRVPMARPGMVYGLKRIRTKYVIPTEGEIYEFAHQLFKSVQLSSECSIVCLIYVERLMEVAKVPLLATTWRPIFMCGLLLASKVWQDLSSWNVEFASVYPQYSLESINRLELEFLRRVKWDLYISSSSYAKYYFALRSLVEKPDFRQRYNRMVGGVDNVQASEALKIEKRSTMVKEEALSQLSRSM